MLDCFVGKLSGNRGGRCRRKYKEVEKERSPDRSLRNAVFRMINPALLASPVVRVKFRSWTAQ